MKVFLLTAILSASICSVASAQLAATLKLNKKNYVAGEPVIAEVVITNHSGSELILASSRQLPWITLVVTGNGGSTVPSRQRNAFGAMKIGIGQTMGRRINLTDQFLLNSQGNFAVSAVIRDPQERISGVATNRVLFNLNPGRTFWSQKVGLKNGEGTRVMKLITFANSQKTQLYAQVIDGKTGVQMQTFSLGNALMLRKPKVTLDSASRMHVMFLATPSMYLHCQVDTDGRLVARALHQRASQGDPALVAFADGSVRVVNSIIYDPEAAEQERQKIRKISDRPSL